MRYILGNPFQTVKNSDNITLKQQVFKPPDSEFQYISNTYKHSNRWHNDCMICFKGVLQAFFVKISDIQEHALRK